MKPAFGQQPIAQEIDSLEKWVAKSLKKDTVWINNLSKLEKLYISSRSPKKGKLAFVILDISRKIKYNKGIDKGLRYMAYQYADEGNYPKALKAAIERLEFNKKYNPANKIIDSYNALMYIYATSGDIQKALESALAAKKEFEHLPKNDSEWFIGFSNTFSGLGNLYIMTGDTRKALKTYQEVLKNIEKAGKQKGTSLSTVRYLEGVAYSNLSNLYAREKKYALSALYAKKALTLSEKYEVQLLLPPVLNTLVESYTNLGDYKNAEQYLKIMGDYHSNNKLQKEEVLDYYKVGRDLFHKQKKFEKAFEFETEYTALKDSLEGKEVKQQLNDLNVKYETAKKEQQNQLLMQQKAVVEKQNRNYVIAIGIFVLLLTVIGFLYRQLFLSRKTVLAVVSELETANQAKDELFRIIAHDIKTPANTFVQLTQLIAHLIKTKNYQRLIEISQKAEFLANDLQTTTNNLMYWAMLKKGIFKTPREKVHVADVFEELKEAFSTYAELHTIHLDTVLNDPNLTINCNRMVLLTVLRNAVSNALKFTPQNGRVSIYAASGINHQVTIEVEDTGKGFSDSDIRLFNQHLKLTSTTGIRGEQGTGLGLSICQELIAHYGGTVSIGRSEKSGGALVQLSL